MELEPQPQPQQKIEPELSESASETTGAPLAPVTIPAAESEAPYRGLKWIFIGPLGLRSGWSVLIFFALLIGFMAALGFLFTKLHLITRGGFTPKNAIFSEMFQLIALVGAVAIVGLIEGRRILDYNLRGHRPVARFFGGFVIGFLALSTLVGGLAAGHWLTFGPATLSSSEIVKYALIWGAVFLMVGCFEEGMFRCYLQYVFTRGLNFWWALGVIGSACGLLAWRTKGEASWGVYLIAALGLLPCLYLHLSKIPRSGFWQAAWATSALFGAVHTGNNGENWIGIFAAALIGFVFCVSIWVTGSAWWAIGCHAAWDWAETYFYGTADSGFVAPGHLFSTRPAGNALWSGGADGPEGSLLVIPVVLLLLAWLLFLHSRRPREIKLSAAEAAQMMSRW